MSLATSPKSIDAYAWHRAFVLLPKLLDGRLHWRVERRLVWDEELRREQWEYRAVEVGR